MIRVLLVLVTTLALLSSQASAAKVEPYRASIETLPASLRSQLRDEFWRPGCPVARWQLRLLTVTNWGFDGRAHEGQLIVHEDVAAPLRTVFRKLHALRFPIRNLTLDAMYGPRAGRPDDVSGSFECRQAVPSPCTGGSASGNWSNHAYGHAIDLNPRENPYVGCGRTRDPTRQTYLDRTHLRKGMVTPAVVRAFRSIGWGWGGEWAGRTKDYMHFSTTGH